MDLDRFYQDHLENVSRSFAFCIPRLRPELRRWISLAYLLFRVVDTIEDSVWPDTDTQKIVFRQFSEFLTQPPSDGSLRTWGCQFPEEIPATEKKLLADLDVLLREFYQLPPTVRPLMKTGLMEMISGMMHFTASSHAGLKTLSELNQYCFFVAGIVGELLTSLVLQRPLKTSEDEALLLQSHHFGLFLQKINILKDQDKDEREGRYFVPERNLILASLKTDADQAFAYLTSLPSGYEDYKLFCAFCFFLALLSLPYIQNSWTAKVVDKIPRALMQQRLTDVETSIGDNGRLRDLYLKHIETLQLLQKPLTVATAATEPRADSASGLAALRSWFDQSYERTLSLQHLQHLGLL